MRDSTQNDDQQLPPATEQTAEPTKPGRSTGPRTPAGKAKSSMNRLTHGLRSDKTILRDEDPAEWEATVQAWLDIYQPQDRKEDELVNEIVHAHWQLKRARKRLEEVEFNLPGNAWNWTEENQKLFANFTRYKTTAERSFNRWYKEMEGHRGRQFREDQIREKARVAAAAVDLQWLNEQEIKANEYLKVTQVVEVEVENGNCITACYPTNQEITDFYAKRAKPPIFVKRILAFLNGVPLEYTWANPKVVEGFEEPQAVQNMLWSRWLDITDHEEALGTGHVGPVSMLRPGSPLRSER